VGLEAVTGDMLKAFPRISRKRNPENEIQKSRSEESAFPSGIKVLYENEKVTIVDIVFVHGLTGDRELTWTSRSDVNWTEKLLPLKVLLNFPYSFQCCTLLFQSWSKIDKVNTDDSSKSSKMF